MRKRLAVSGLVFGIVLGPTPAKGIDPRHLALQDCPAEPGCPALILSDETILNNESLRARYSIKRRIKLFTREGVDLFGTVSISEIVGEDDVRNLNGRTILPNGKVLKAKREHMSVKTVYKQGRFRVRLKSLLFPGAVPGAIIEYSVDKFSVGPANLGTYVWEIQQGVPVESSRLTLKHGGIHYQWLQAGQEEVEIRHESPFPNAIHFEATAVPSIPHEIHGPPERAWRSRVFFLRPTYTEFWRLLLIGAESQRARNWMDDSTGVAEKVAELTAMETTTLGRVRSIYSFIQGEIRDLGPDDDIGETDGVGTVLKRGSGSEYDKTLLFLAMVKELELPYGLLLIASRESAVMDPQIPDFDQYDTYAAAVEIDGRWRYLDPATRHCRFGILAPQKEGLEDNALVIVPESLSQTALSNLGDIQNNAGAVTIPATQAARNVLLREVTVQLEASGAARVRVADQGSGHVDLDHRQLYSDLTDSERAGRLQAQLTDAIPSAKLTSVEISGLDSYGKKALIVSTFTVPDLGKRVQDNLIFPGAFLHPLNPIPGLEEARRTPVYLPHTMKSVETIAFSLPDGYEMDSVPERAGIHMGEAGYESEYSVSDGGELVFVRRFEIDQTIWETDEYPDLRSFLEKVRVSDNGVVTLRRMNSLGGGKDGP